MSTARVRNPSLDALRALAITLVVGMHVVPPVSWLPELAATALTFGARGVDLFFVLSGYLVGGIVLRELAPHPSWRSAAGFYRRRAYRILPAYFAVFALYLGTIPLPRDAPLPALWPYLFFLQTYVNGPPAFFAVSWSLCIEEHFYWLLPPAVAALHAVGARKPATFALAFGALAVGLAVFRISLPDLAVDEKVSHFRTDGLLAGVVVAAIEQALPRGFAPLAARRALAGGLVLASLAVAAWTQLHAEDSSQSAFAVACAGLVVLAAARSPSLDRIGRHRAVRHVARISYALYLVHPLVFRSLDKAYFGRRWESPVFAAAFAVLALGGALGVAELLHRFVEAPLLARRDRPEPGAPLRS